MAVPPMQGTQCLWYDHYRGSLYPLDLESPPTCGDYQTTESPSLLDLSCAHIVKDAALTRAAIDNVPTILRVNLMEAALRGNHDRSIQALMSRWKLHKLVLKCLVPGVFTSLLPFYLPTYQSDLVRQGLRYTTALAHTFLECLRQSSPTKLRHLDLTGFPAAEVILYYLCSHCMLSHNERRRNNMISLYNAALNMAQDCPGAVPGSHGPLDASMQNCLPDDVSIEIKLDAFVTSESCHSELCKALTVSAFPETRFRLVVEKLSITCLGGDRVILLLKQLQPQEVKGLQLKYNSLENSHLLLMAPTLQSMSWLAMLDLSCNHLSLFQEPAAVVFSQVLMCLKNLRRLDLSNNRLKNQLGTILSGLRDNLQQLRLAACGLTSGDMAALATASKLTSIEELDLSENSLTPCFISLGRVISNNCQTLKVLELEDSRLSDEVMMTLNSSFSSLEKLLFLNFTGNKWWTSTALNLVEKLSLLNKLKVLKFPYSQECYSDYEMFSTEMDRFKLSMTSVLESQRVATGVRTRVKLILVPPT